MFSVNFLSNKDLSNEVIRQHILAKNPIIFYISENENENIFKALNISRSFSKYVLTLYKLDFGKGYIFVNSFKDWEDKQILFLSDDDDRVAVLDYVKGLIKFLKSNNSGNSRCINFSKD